MPFIDLKKRLAARRDTAKPQDSAEGTTAGVAAEQASEAAAVANEAAGTPADPLASTPTAAGAEATEPAPGEEADEPLPPAPVPSWDASVLAVLADALPRNRDVLLAGLGPWGRNGSRGLPEALLGRARAITALDPDKARLVSARGYCQRTLEAELLDPELGRRLGLRYGVVVVSDALVTQADPVALLRHLRGVLAPDGELVAVVPNQAHASRRLALLTGDAPREFEPGGVRHHYTRTRLRELLAFAGYALVDVRPVEASAFDADPGLVPQLFSPAVLAALGPDLESKAAYFVARAVPAPAASLLRELFDEQEALRKAARNEIAAANAACDEMERALKTAEYTRDQAVTALEEARRKEAGLNELVARADQNVKRLGKEVDDAQRELSQVKANFWYRLGKWLAGPKAHRPLEFASSGPDVWKHDGEPKSRYLT